MDRYIEKNLEIQHIFQDYAAVEDILSYSIDEGFIDLTSSLNYFIRDKKMTRKAKLDVLVGEKRVSYIGTIQEVMKNILIKIRRPL